MAETTSAADPTEVPTGIDAPAVTRWFAQHVPTATAPLAFSRVAGGHSCLTFIVTDADGVRFVLRRPPLGVHLATAHDVAREFRLMGALAGSRVPVPTMLGLCEDVSVNEAPFYVMSHVDGVVLHDASMVEAALPSAELRRRASEQLVDALAALHAVDPVAVGLGDMIRPGSYLDRQLKRWSTQWEASKTRELPGMDQLHDWLVANRPKESAQGIVHGDFRFGNMLIGTDGTLNAVLDWELCTFGDPLADVSYLVRSWASPDDPPSPNLDPPTRAGGFFTREEVVARYAEVSGRDVSDLGYWMAFNAWRSAAIGEGVYRRYIDGQMGALPDDVEMYAARRRERRRRRPARRRPGLTPAGRPREPPSEPPSRRTDLRVARQASESAERIRVAPPGEPDAATRIARSDSEEAGATRRKRQGLGDPGRGSATRAGTRRRGVSWRHGRGTSRRRRAAPAAGGATGTPCTPRPRTR